MGEAATGAAVACGPQIDLLALPASRTCSRPATPMPPQRRSMLGRGGAALGLRRRVPACSPHRRRTTQRR